MFHIRTISFRIHIISRDHPRKRLRLIITFLTVVAWYLVVCQIHYKNVYAAKQASCGVTEPYVLPSIEIRLFKKNFKTMKIHHRKHKKCCVLNTLCLRSLVSPTRFDLQNISFCKTGVAKTTITTTTFHIFHFFKIFQNVSRFQKKKIKMFSKWCQILQT